MQDTHISLAHGNGGLYMRELITELFAAHLSNPVRDPVHAVCDMLGYDPLFLACEGRVVAVIAESEADALLKRWRQLPAGQEASIIGELTEGTEQVVLETELGGERLLQELEDDPLPRIC